MVIAELMILGFISLLLSFGQSYIAKICIPLKVANSMLPCQKDNDKSASSEEEHRRRLLWFERRFLAGAESATKCKDVSVMLPNLFLVVEFNLFDWH